MEKGEKRVASLEEFEQEAVRFARNLAPLPSSATLVTLTGELGAGKTAFTKAVAATLGVEESVTSPTFVLEKIYQLPAPAAGSGFKRLIHIDAYRLEEAGEQLAPLGFIELHKSPENLIMLEWPERVSSELPPATISITIEALEDGSRTISYA